MQAAVTAELAVLIQILLVAPMRLANLAALHLEKNVISDWRTRADLPPRHST